MQNQCPAQREGGLWCQQVLKSKKAVYIIDSQRQSFINCNRSSLSMGKKTKKIQSHPEDIRSFPISRQKSFNHNLNTFLRMLQEKHTGLTSREFIMEVHSFVTRYKQQTKKKDPSIGTARHKIKICKHCDGWSRNSPMLQCTRCEDYYHQHCLGHSKTAFESSGLCQDCDTDKIMQFDKDAYLSELIQDRCQQCGEERQVKEAFVHCLRCSKRFHKKCYGRNVVVCTSCKNQIDQQLKNKKPRQSTIEEWCSSKKKKAECRISLNTDPQLSEDRFKYEEESRTQPFREKDLFSNNFDQMTIEDIEKYKNGLMFAILAKNMQYTEELHPVQCSLDNSNEESLDFGLDHMTKTEYEAYRYYKKQPIGPFRFVFKEGMGYDVVADRDIREKTIICEYIGEVVSLRKCIQLEATSKNDSLMELRTGYNSEETLIIRPEKWANMARFLNGINNSKNSNKANVCTVRKLAKGMPAVILFSCRNIKKGQSLLYDYNAGTTTCQYDTSGFI